MKSYATGKAMFFQATSIYQLLPLHTLAMCRGERLSCIKAILRLSGISNFFQSSSQFLKLKQYLFKILIEHERTSDHISD
jgi:hypothetical protein